MAKIQAVAITKIKIRIRKRSDLGEISELGLPGKFKLGGDIKESLEMSFNFNIKQNQLGCGRQTTLGMKKWWDLMKKKQ